jgi:hypothetical protein
VWRLAHDTCRADADVVQLMLLGVNAHINYDLVLVLVELLRPDWPEITEVQRRQRYTDYTHVNAIIARTIDEVQDEIVEPATPALRIVDLLLGRLDEWATERLITGWREEVWQHAVAMLEAADAAGYEDLRGAVEASTLRRAAWVLGYFDLP